LTKVPWKRTVRALVSGLSPRMNAFINFVEFENRVIAATYRNLMIRAKIILVEQATGEPLSDPITTITSPAPNGSLRIRLPETVRPGRYLLRALNLHGEPVAQSVEFLID
jgi:hypothetical protein